MEPRRDAGEKPRAISVPSPMTLASMEPRRDAGEKTKNKKQFCSASALQWSPGVMPGKRIFCRGTPHLASRFNGAPA